MSEIEDGILFTQAELDEAVFEVLSSCNPADGLTYEDLVQDISIPDPDVQQFNQIIKDDVHSESTGLSFPSGSQVYLKFEGSVRYEPAEVKGPFQYDVPMMEQEHLSSYDKTHNLKTLKQESDTTPGMSQPKMENSRKFLSLTHGPWQGNVLYKAIKSGSPGIPQHTRVTRIKEGVKLTWEDPCDSNGPILEYSLYLAIPPIPIETGPMSLKRVYRGAAKECIVSNQSLAGAFVDTSFGAGRPAFIFRLAARNVHSYGPAVQVRWIQRRRNGLNY